MYVGYDIGFERPNCCCGSTPILWDHRDGILVVFVTRTIILLKKNSWEILDVFFWNCQAQFSYLKSLVAQVLNVWSIYPIIFYAKNVGKRTIKWVFLKWWYPQIIHFNRVRFSIINHPFWGTPIFGNIHILWAWFSIFIIVYSLSIFHVAWNQLTLKGMFFY